MALINPGPRKTTSGWSREEVEAIVADHIHMLTLELAGQAYSKTEHRRSLQQKLTDRSEGSIERKHQNISAVLIELGCPFISGYKPLGNYQQLLFDVTASRVLGDTLFDQAALAAVEQPAAAPLATDFSSLITDAPEVDVSMAEQTAKPYRVKSVGLIRDYLEREARNRSLGTAGEEFVVAYEQHRLHFAGAKQLSDRVERISVAKGDGLGYDVLSFDADGRERFIEVKTTTFGREAPFYVSRNEVEFSKVTADQFHLYRLFEFRRQPRMFDLPGSVQARCLLDPVTYLARFS